MRRDTDIVGAEEDETELYPEDEVQDEDYDVGMWDVENRDLETLEYNTVNVLEEMKQDRAKLLHYGEQYDILPHMRCYQCGKVIGDLWEPYLEYSRERYYKPGNIVDLLPLNEDEKTDLRSAIGTPDFLVLLNEFDVKSDYDILKEQRKYTNEQIFNKLGGRLLLPEDEREELVEALPNPKKFRKLLKDHGLESEYNEAIRIKVVNDLYGKPLLPPEVIDELSQSTDKIRKFQSLLRRYDLKDQVTLTLNVANRVIGNMFEEGSITEEHYFELTDIILGKEETKEASSLQPVKYQRVIVGPSGVLGKMRPGFTAGTDHKIVFKDLSKLLTKFKKKKIYDTKLNEYIVEELGKIKILNQIQQRNLLALKNKPEQFQSALEKYGITKIFENAIKEKGYNASLLILERLGGKLLRPCCRMNLLSPIHVPIKQEAFEEVAKTIQNSNVLMDSQAIPISVIPDLSNISDISDISDISYIPDIPEEGHAIPDPDTREIAGFETYGTPTPLLTPIPEPLAFGECNIPKKKTAVPLTQLGKIEDPEPDFDDDIEDVGESEMGREDQVHVGAGRVVQRKSRRYRAR